MTKKIQSKPKKDAKPQLKRYSLDKKKLIRPIKRIPIHEAKRM